MPFPSSDDPDDNLPPSGSDGQNVPSEIPSVPPLATALSLDPGSSPDPGPPGLESGRFLERDSMAWPPAGWERPVPGWRGDLALEGSPVPGIGVWPGGGEAALEPAGSWTGDWEVPVGPASAPRRRVMREIVETLVLAAVIFIGIRQFVLQFKIEGSSMSPTLENGQYVLVNRLSYRLLGDPDRGDIIVFEAWNSGKDYIKRVIGLPGQRVEVRDGTVSIDGMPLDEAYLHATNTTGQSSVTLGPDEYFVMGDNRDNSQDSRVSGALSREKIIGKAWVIYWPLHSISVIPDSSQVRPFQAGAGG